jgi:stage IV sporulation protein FB
MEYPAKPVPAISQNVIWKSVLSLIGFLAVYYFVFDESLFNTFTVVIVLVIHEAGHFLTMKHYNYQDVKMFFLPFLGAYVSGEKEKVSQKQKALVIMAGPVPGIIIGLILNFIGWYTGTTELRYIANVFVLVNAFNLLPITPLDGGRLIEVLFVGSKEIIQIIFILISILIMGIVIYLTESYILLLLILFLIMRIRLTWKIKGIREDLSPEGALATKSYSELSDEEYWKIRKALIKRMPELKKEGHRDNQVSQDEESIINMIKNVLDQPPVYDLSVFAKIIFVITLLVFLIILPILNYLLFTFRY